MTTPPRSRERGHHTTGYVWVAAAALFGACLSWEVVALGPAAVRGVYLLPLADRTSLVVELDTSGRRATVVEADDPEAFVVDIGPVTGSVEAMILRAAPSSTIVREVSVRRLSVSSEASVVRVQVKLRKAVAGSVRTADRRVYIDLAPEVQRPRVTPAAVQTVVRPAAPAAPESDEAVLDRARTLASAPDVKGLVDLKAGVVQLRERSDGPSSADSAGTDALLARIDEYLGEAQQRQLAKDAKLFQQVQEASRYRTTLQEALSGLDAIETTLRSGNVEADTLSHVGTESSQIAARLRESDAPPPHAVSHARIRTEADAAAAAVARMSVADRTSSVDALAAIDRARAALKSALGASASSPAP